MKIDDEEEVEEERWNIVPKTDWYDANEEEDENDDDEDNDISSQPSSSQQQDIISAAIASSSDPATSTLSPPVRGPPDRGCAHLIRTRIRGP